jgi:hypothetical protein
MVALPTTLGGAQAEITQRIAASSVAIGQTSPTAPCVLALLGAPGLGIHQRRRQGH